MCAAISTKAICWEYEHEWRYVEPRGGEFPLPGPIVEIVFGLRCPTDRREEYEKLARKFLGNDVRIYEMRKIENSKALERVRIGLLIRVARHKFCR